jgi:hypothetical protein
MSLQSHRHVCAALVLSTLGLQACGPEQPWQRHRVEWERSIETALSKRPSWQETREIAEGFRLQVDPGPPAIAAVSRETDMFLFDRDGQLPSVTRLPHDDRRARGFRALYGADLETCASLDARWYHCKIT